MEAKVYPYPISQPTGEELMSGPITSGVVTRKEKEVQYVVRDIEKRLGTLKADETFQTYKVQMFTFALLFLLAGVILFLFGTSTTVLFEEQKFNPTAIAFGGLFCLPMIVWMKYMTCPPKPEHQRRKSLKQERRASKGPKVFEKLVKAAQKFAEPPPRRIKVSAIVRKVEYKISASTWKSFCEEIEHQTGLPIERQIVKFRDEELKIDLKLKLDEHFGLDTGDRLYVYNRGGFTTQNSPVRKQYEELASFNPDANDDVEAPAAGSWMESAFSAARNSFREKHRPNSKSKGGGAGGGRSSFQEKQRGSRSSFNQKRSGGNVSFSV